MPRVKATFEIRNDRSEEYPAADEGEGVTGHHQGGHGEVNVSEQRRRTITASRELTGVEDAVWAIEAKEYEIVWDLWEHIRETEDFSGWGFRSPYPNGDISVDLDHHISVHDIVWHIAQRENAEPPGVYLDLMHNSRIYGDSKNHGTHRRVRALVTYLAAVGVDTSYWTHGHEPGKFSSYKSPPDEMLEHVGYEPDE